MDFMDHLNLHSTSFKVKCPDPGCVQFDCVFVLVSCLFVCLIALIIIQPHLLPYKGFRGCYFSERWLKQL